MAIQVLDNKVELSPAPLRREWVLEGRPLARNAILARSEDRTTLTILWDCTGGRFRWVYEQDETIHVLEGGATLTLDDGRVVELKPGEMIFFPQGTTAEWRVHGYIRKLAVFREPLPTPLALFMRARAKLRPRAWLARLPGRFAPAGAGQLQPA